MECPYMTFTLDTFRLVFLTITLVVYLVTGTSLPQLAKVTKNTRRFLLFYSLTFFATIGIFLSADLFTTFFFFEIMTLTSFAYVGNEETEFSRKAAMSYLVYGITGGLVMLFGIMLLYSMTGTLSYDRIPEQAALLTDRTRLYIAGGCLLFGFGAKAGMYPLHTWLPDTYTAAPCAGTTVLSAVLSKAGIFGIILVSDSLFGGDRVWALVLAVLGCLTMFTGGVLGLFSTNIKRTLACSSMSQIGFILVAEGSMNSGGALFHTINHSLFKLILFTIVSMIFGMTKELDYNKLAGFANDKKWLKIPFLCAALGISGVPLFSGYISKTMIHTMLEELMSAPYGGSIYTIIEKVFLISGGLTFAYMLKLYIALFHNKPNADSVPPDTCIAKTGLVSKIQLGGLGALCFFIGVGFFLINLAYAAPAALLGSVISLGIGAVIYFIPVRLWMTRRREDGGVYYPDIYPSWLNIETLIYRPLLMKFLPFIGAFFCRIFDRLVDGFSILVMKTVLRPSGGSHIREDHPLAYFIGKIADGIFYIIHVKIRKESPVDRTSYADLFTVGTTEFSRTTRLILYSVSFGLMLFSLGLMAALIYLLYAF